MDYKPMRYGRRRRFRRTPSSFGVPKWGTDDVVGKFTIIRYEGHSSINKRTAQQMSKAQHWYRCLCTCGTEEYRSQQELVDPRRQKCCFNCRDIHVDYEVNQNDHHSS
jgi:hypothetical protein